MRRLWRAFKKEASYASSVFDAVQDRKWLYEKSPVDYPKNFFRVVVLAYALVRGGVKANRIDDETVVLTAGMPDG